MLESNPDLSADQAQKLRELAQNQPSNRQAQEMLGSPHCILVAEFPMQGRSGPLAWFLVNEMHRRMQRHPVGRRSLLVDLAPSASRFMQIAEALRRCKLCDEFVNVQPLWEETAHGPALRSWSADSGRGLDIVAQLQGPLPSSEQFKRISEQLVRQLAVRSQWNGTAGYDLVVMFTSAEGIGLDNACWRAADDLIVVWSPELCTCEQLEIQLQDRLPQVIEMQRVSCVAASNRTLLRWADWSGYARLALSPQSANGTQRELQRRWYARWARPLPAWPRTGYQLRCYQRTARRIAARLSRVALRQVLRRNVG